MRKAFHYTSKANWDLIQQARVLEPKGKIIRKHYLEGVEGVDHKLAEKLFTFAFLDSPIPSGWEGLMFDSLLEGRIGKERVLLSFPLTDEEVYVAERGHLMMVDEYRDMGLKNRHIAEYLKEYVQSIVPLRDYAGNYWRHELLIADKIPIVKIKLEETN